MNYISSFLKVINHPVNRQNKVRSVSRILWWKANQLFFHLPSIVEVAPGIKCICYPASSFGGLVVYTKLPEFKELEFLKDVLNKNDIFLDIGANIGIFSLVAASKITSGKIYAFEPFPDVYDKLSENIRLNDLGHLIKVVKKVVSDKSGKEEFLLEDKSETASIVNRTNRNLAFKKIPSIKLDDFISAEHLQYIDLVKIDVEGAEFKVLKGFSDYIKRGKVGSIIFEINKNNIYFDGDTKRILSFLIKNQYHIFNFENNYLKKLESYDYNPVQTINLIAIHKLSKKLNKFKYIN